ncbi:50S ribosomal protein L27 [bacterium CG10_46_32]|nr:MAG: 50S ribosomal protein L27 [bacterium CG10_46_32]PIR55810.1 MAG: 50S ribosomal protein L27 [Parcubacteria group bacterium CG10_big_fil_rev_8_21_14_0_10_46_32]
MAHKKAGGSTSNLRDSKGQRLGVKLYGGEFAQAGAIIVRQRGTRYFAGENVKRSKDDSMFAIKEGAVLFKKKMKRGYDGNLKQRVEVNVVAVVSK